MTAETAFLILVAIVFLYLAACRAFADPKDKMQVVPCPVPSWERPSGPTAPVRKPLWSFGDVLRTRHGFVGAVDAIYADYWSARCSNVIPDGWFEIQTIQPSTKDQVFYGLVALDGKGAVLSGELDVEPLDVGRVA